MYANLRAPSLASYLVLNWVQLYQVGLSIHEATVVREHGIDVLARITTEAYSRAWGL